jgi:hypothetical protein
VSLLIKSEALYEWRFIRTMAFQKTPSGDAQLDLRARAVGEEQDQRRNFNR